MTRSITIVVSEETAIDVAEAVSIRKAKLQHLVGQGVEIKPEKIDRLSVASRVLDKALAPPPDTS